MDLQKTIYEKTAYPSNRGGFEKAFLEFLDRDSKVVKSLSAKERAFLARCLISSLDITQEESVDGEWAELAQKRYEELKSGLVNSISWDKIKKEVRS